MVMPDPVQVVAVARAEHRWDTPSDPIDAEPRCTCGWGPAYDAPLWVEQMSVHVDEAIVAALQAAGALMPSEAAALQRDKELWLGATAATAALLQKIDQAVSS